MGVLVLFFWGCLLGVLGVVVGCCVVCFLVGWCAGVRVCFVVVGVVVVVLLVFVGVVFFWWVVLWLGGVLFSGG
ncbi:hypothetical protein, partial [Salmonella enterica]|uniref:hypothetical protein n=1 Tax=Salmonella enterica TaxID=28901 RepID=UPI0020C1BCE5